MIARLRGRVIEREPDRVVVDCGGVGYEVAVSAHTWSALPAAGEEVTLRVYTAASENKVALYGFHSAEERALFDLLITVKNVGPTTALGILSHGASPAALARAIAASDKAALTAVKGIGKKTAEMLVAELREKCELLLATWSAAGGGLGDRVVVAAAPAPERRARALHPLLEQVHGALVNLGWRPAEADKAVTQLAPDEGASLESLLRQALRAMPR
jgi:Holliday junction DNA helicase RuvA